MEYLFRKAENKDLMEVISLFQEVIANMIKRQLFQWDEMYPNEQVLSEDINKAQMYLLTKDEKIIACVVINEVQDEEYQSGHWSYTSGKLAVIHRLCVRPSAQGAGCGKKMVRLAEEQAKSDGYEIMRLDAFSQNLGARHVYETLGYTYAGEVTFRKGLFYLMEKALG